MNRTYKKAALVGCGGIGCAIGPALAKMLNLVLIDADNYEPSNSSRQFPALKSTGNKAKVLSEMLQEQTVNKVEYIPKFLKDAFILNEKEWEGVDLIIAGVDNNPSRRIIAELGQELNIPVILAGNSHEHGEAHLVWPGVYNPFGFFEFPDGDPVPWGCNTDKVLEEFPQTIIANSLAAGCALHIFLSIQAAKKPQNMVAYSRSDALCSEFAPVKVLLKKARVAEPVPT